MDREDDEIRFALGVLDDHRRLIAAGKTQRWDIVKWAVTVNIALAGASVTLKHQDGKCNMAILIPHARRGCPMRLVDGGNYAPNDGGAQ